MKKGKDEGIFFRNDQKSTIHCLKENILNPGICTPLHYHKYNEILYGIDCDIKVWIDDRLEFFKSGDLCFFNSDEAHFMFSEKEENTYYVIKFSPEILSYEGQMLSELRYLISMLHKNDRLSHIIPKTEFDEYEMKEIFENVIDEWNGEKTGYEFAIRGQILRLLSLMFRVWEKSHNPYIGENDENTMAVYRALSYINEHYDTVSERELSENLHMSYHHFSRTFKKVTGRNFLQFVIDKRIDVAKNLLLTTSQSVTDIAQKTGFSSASHFIAAFKQRVGMTPNKYKKSISV